MNFTKSETVIWNQIWDKFENSTPTMNDDARKPYVGLNKECKELLERLMRLDILDNSQLAEDDYKLSNKVGTGPES